MKNQTIVASVLLLFASHAHAQSSPPPESFVQQIEVNLKKLTDWEKVYTRDQSFYKIRAYGPTALSIDVIRSESVLRPYLGKLHFAISFARGDNFEAREQAKESAAYVGPSSLNTHECFLDFAPNKTAWEVTKIRCRSTQVRNLLELDREMINGKPLGDVFEILETELNNGRQKLQHQKRLS